jgi:hypothetical protein
MFDFYRNLFIQESAKVESELRRAVADRDAIIESQREEISQLKAKVERMELVLMPLSSASGAAYAASLNPRKREIPKVPVDATETSWQAYLRNYLKEQEALDAKEKANGTQS